MIADWFGLEPKHLSGFELSFNVAPQTFQPVVRLASGTGEREVVLMRWGLVPFWARDARDGVKRINARAESIVSTASFREAVKSRRCLVPADAFYEWQKIGAKTRQAFAISMSDDSPYPMQADWVFASPTMKGTQPYWRDNLMKRYIKPAAHRLGIDKKIGWHTFRHSFGTLLNANGEDVKTVQELLRHANSRITLDVYTQAVNSTKRAAQSKVVRMMAPNAGTKFLPVGTIESGEVTVNAR